MAVKKLERKYRLDIITERFLLEIVKVISSDTLISKRMLSNINKLFDNIDLEYYYKKNNELAVLIKTIKIIANIKKYNHIFDTNGAIVEIQANLSNEAYEKFLNNTIIPTIEANARKEYSHKIEELGKAISIYLQYGFVLNLKGELMSKINDIESSYGSELVDNILSLKTMINQLNEYFRGTEASNIMGGLVHMVEDPYIDSLMETHMNLKDPGTVLRTGIQALNRSLSPRGGFVPGLYFIYACTNHWKSALLKQISIMVQQFNTYIFETREFKDNDKIPTILYVTLENSRYEDDERDFKMRTHMDLDSFPNAEDAVKKWKANFYKHVDEKGRVINICVYRPDEVNGIQQKFRCSDLIDLIDTLNEEGYKVIMAEIDYFQLISPEKEDEHRELRIQYGIIAAMLLQIFRRYNIPIIVPHQLNRDAERLINEMKREGKLNIVTMLGAQYIGESYWIEKAATHSAYIMLENHPVTHQLYLGYKRGKTRGRVDPEWPHFYHEIHNGLCLEYDIDKPQPISRKSLTVDGDPVTMENYEQVKQTVGIRGRTTPIAKPKNDPIIVESKDTFDDLVNSFKQTEDYFKKPTFQWISKKDREPRRFIRSGDYYWIESKVS